MTFRTLIRRSLRFHWRAHLGVTLGAAIGSAALIGALVVGDSVKETLRGRALSRLGQVHYAINTQDRLFRGDLRQRLAADRATGTVRVDTTTPAQTRPFSACVSASALSLSGMVVRQDSGARANQVNVLGVESPAWPRLAGWGTIGPGLSVLEDGREFHLDEVARMQMRHAQAPLTRWRAGETALINETLARQLSAQPGDEIVVRVRKPSALGLDAVISTHEEATVAMRLRIGAILSVDQLGDCSLTANQSPAANLFLPLDLLAQRVGVEGRANLLVSSRVLIKPKFSWWDAQRHKLAGWLRWRAHRPLPPGFAPPGGTARFEDPTHWFSRVGRGLEPELIRTLPDASALPWLNSELQRAWLPEDAELTVQIVEQPQTVTGGEYVQPCIEISSPRVFLDALVIDAALTPRDRLLTNHRAYANDTTNDVATSAWITNGFGVLTYLVNLIQAGERAVPYSMVTAAGPPFTPMDLRDDEILISAWLADDLQVKPDDTVQLIYFIADSGSQLTERTNRFRVRGVVPMRGVHADRTLMPEFPGLARAERTRDWDTAFPLVYTIRQKDEDYWEQNRGTPKAFIALTAGQALWANRYGELTAIRYPVPTNSFSSVWREVVYRNLLANLDPPSIGLRFEPVREQALKAAEQSQDFGGLFLGFSFFLIAAALLLMAMLFQLGLEQRAPEIGTLLALGFTPKQVRKLLLGEGIALSLLGGVAGALGGLVYAKAMLHGLTTVWQDAVGATALSFHATGQTLLIGLFASVVVSVVTIWLTLRKFARRAPRELLAGEIESAGSKTRSPRTKVLAISSLAAALGLAGWMMLKGDTANAGAFFGAGALVLIAGLGFVSAWLGSVPRTSCPQDHFSSNTPDSPKKFDLPAGRRQHVSLGSLGLRGCARRRKRSLATVAMLACGSFLIVSIGVFRLDANRDATRKTSGTGGFALIGETTMPVVQDLNSQPGREFFALNEADLKDVNFVPFRVREGDEASCLNLNRAQTPRLLGVKPELLEGRFAFARGSGWNLLRSRARESADGRGETMGLRSHERRYGAGGEIPAIGDANSIQWAMGKKVGDSIDYVDERGQPFKVRIVGAVANSILQGQLLIDEAEFVRRFPNESGYRQYLIDAPTNRVAEVSAVLSRALQDVGLELTPAAQRLAQFNAVQNTYLGTFQVLGGLGLLLGSVGLGIVVLRNVLERRGELAVLLAVGFRKPALQRLLLIENGALLGLGLALGVIAAAVAVFPALLSPTTQLPWLTLTLTLAAVLLNGTLWTWAATRVALRGDLLAALRNE
jgi:ABC-type antimicrobial peptide transport system permease subunit